jgi:hypothetical protein
MLAVVRKVLRVTEGTAEEPDLTKSSGCGVELS